MNNLTTHPITVTNQTSDLNIISGATSSDISPIILPEEAKKNPRLLVAFYMASLDNDSYDTVQRKAVDYAEEQLLTRFTKTVPGTAREIRAMRQDLINKYWLWAAGALLK